MTIEPTTSQAMECGDLGRAVDAYLDGEFDARDRAEADAHLAGCEACRGLVEAQRRLRDAVRAKLREAMTPPAQAGRAPPALRVRIEASLARERRPLWRRLLSPLPLSAAVACAAGALLVLSTHGGDDVAVTEAVRSHHRRLPLELVTPREVNEASIAVNEASIAAWFAGKLDFRPSPPPFRGDGVHLLGARLSNLRELPAAYIRYDLPRGQAGLFIVDDPRGTLEPGGREVQVGPQTLRVIASRGYNVAVWRDHEIVYSLVSDLDESALLDLVRTAQAR
jgi:anti-sigma factor RsiW